MAEHRSEDDEIVVVHGELGFRRCSLVLAVPEGWVDVTSVSDLAEVAVELRSAGRELRVATKYPNLTRQFLYDRGMTYFELVEVSGAIEAAPALETADIICDITSSGVTLRENRLKTVAGGVVVESQACLIGNRRGLLADPERLEATRGLLELIEAYLRSRQQVSITANIRGESAEAVARRVLASGGWLACAGRRSRACFPRTPPTATGSRSRWSSARTCCCRRSSRCAAPARARSPRRRSATSSSTARGRSRRSSGSFTAQPTATADLREDHGLVVLVVDPPAGLAPQVGDQVGLLGHGSARGS